MRLKSLLAATLLLGLAAPALAQAPLKIALIVVAFPFVLMFLSALLRHHGS